MQGVVKYLLKFYTQKQVAMITKLRQSYINKIANYKIGANATEVSALEPQMEERRQLLEYFLTVPILTYYGFSPQDKIYIAVLKYLGVPKDDIRNLYINSLGGFTRNYHKSFDIVLFESEKIGVDKEKFLDLIEVRK